MAAMPSPRIPRTQRPMRSAPYSPSDPSGSDPNEPLSPGPFVTGFQGSRNRTLTPSLSFKLRTLQESYTSRRANVGQVVPHRKNHQHHDDREPNAEPHFLNAL